MSKSIKFTHAQSGELDCRTGKTVFSNLFVIGVLALTKTAKYKEKDDNLTTVYQTDAEGLRGLETMTQEAMLVLARTIASLGTVLAYVEKDEVESELDSYHWLIAGLAELSGQLTEELGDIRRALGQASE
jgi:hypothetical protein